MTSRERVLCAFAHEEPDRVPRWCGASPEFIAKAKLQFGLSDTEALFRRFGDDFRRVFARYAGPEAFGPSSNLQPGATYRSAFGVERHGYGCGQPLSHPLAQATLEEVHAYPWPNPDWADVSQLRAEALSWNRQYAILGGDYTDFWIGYQRRIFNNKVGWRVQLNVRNVFAEGDPIVVQVQPNGSPARVSIPVPRQFVLSSTFTF